MGPVHRKLLEVFPPRRPGGDPAVIGIAVDHLGGVSDSVHTFIDYCADNKAPDLLQVYGIQSIKAASGMLRNRYRKRVAFAVLEAQAGYVTSTLGVNLGLDRGTGGRAGEQEPYHRVWMEQDIEAGRVQMVPRSSGHQ